MFGIGFSEVVIVFLAVIIFVRPGDLPKFLRMAGRLYGRAKRTYSELTDLKDRIIREIDEAASPAEPPAVPPPVPAEDHSNGRAS
jgi:Sec-independent protein translocase protein TatA